ncbi:MAG: hypothetical protein IJN20_01055 [Oscillospiraceae bacterium]|nr:hypothetical protein [Oscillospiraceae bacterium]
MVQKNITRQAILAGLTVVLTIVILFAMTSAWYTNIVPTSGLTFEAEAWGFDGEITVNNDSIMAAPGDQGLVYLEVENDSDSISAISINVSKNQMDDEEMKKRLYLYVDTHMHRDGETMNRVYLNNYESYTYTVFNKSNLTLTESVSNAPQLKWQWVYDVLGYYVMAKPIRDENNNIISMNITEYLRPIEYTFDDATMEMTNDENPTMSIVTVDGKTDPYTYLRSISKTDGYEGEIQNNPLSNGYYPVDVDAKTEYGVYAYLCNYAEIQQATEYDTKLGKLALRKANNDTTLTAEDLAKLTHDMTLRISAQQNEAMSVTVDTLNALDTVLQQGTADVVQLSRDITIPDGQSLKIPSNSRVMVDLNQFTLKSSSGTAVQAEPGSSLTLINGTLEGPNTDTATYGINTTGAEVVMGDVDVKGFRYGVYLGDNRDLNALDSRVHMVGCTIDADYYAAFINGNGLLSTQKTQLIIEDSTLTSKGMVITGNGTSTGNGRYGTDIQIMNSTLKQIPYEGETTLKPGAGIYQPQKDSTLTILNSTVSGYNGIALKGGTATIIGSTIRGEGVESVTPVEFANSGYIDTADAVYIETNYEYEIALFIQNGTDPDNPTVSTITSAKGKSVRVFEENATNYKVEITGGTFDHTLPEAFIPSGYTQKNNTVVKE